jgi:DNA-directed RNA polymerase specialized sigma24 family protein
MKLACSRSRSREDAEDAVAETLMRAASSPLQGDELARWLTAVLLNVCADAHRRHYREQRLMTRLAWREESGHPGHEDEVLSRLSATQQLSAVKSLPPRQSAVLLQRGDGGGVDEIASGMGITYKAAESLLARARASARAALTAAGSALLALLGLIRRRPPQPLTLVTIPAALCLAVSVPFLGSAGHGPMAGADGTASASASAQSRDLAPRALPGVAIGRHRAAERVGAGGTTSKSTFVPRRTATAAGVHVEVGGAQRSTEHEDFVTSARRCLEQGVDVGLEHVGCRAGHSTTAEGSPAVPR